MTYRSYNSETEQAQNSLPGPDLAPLVKEAGWRYYPERRVKEYVRADGTVIDRQTMASEEVARMTTKQQGETIMKQETEEQPVGDAQPEYKPMMLNGEKFNHVTILGYSGNKNKYGSKLVLCECSCGKRFEAPASAITGGAKKSCGHLKGDRLKTRKTVAVESVKKRRTAPRAAKIRPGKSAPPLSYRARPLTQCAQTGPARGIGPGSHL